MGCVSRLFFGFLVFLGVGWMVLMAARLLRKVGIKVPDTDGCASDRAQSAASILGKPYSAGCVPVRPKRMTSNADSVCCVLGPTGMEGSIGWVLGQVSNLVSFGAQNVSSRKQNAP